jgi:hypothetical protein
MKMSSAILGALLALFVLAGSGLSAAHAAPKYYGGPQ